MHTQTHTSLYSAPKRYIIVNHDEKRALFPNLEVIKTNSTVSAW